MCSKELFLRIKLWLCHFLGYGTNRCRATYLPYSGKRILYFQRFRILNTVKIVNKISRGFRHNPEKILKFWIKFPERRLKYKHSNQNRFWRKSWTVFREASEQNLQWCYRKPNVYWDSQTIVKRQKNRCEPISSKRNSSYALKFCAMVHFLIVAPASLWMLRRVHIRMSELCWRFIRDSNGKSS